MTISSTYSRIYSGENARWIVKDSPSKVVLRRPIKRKIYVYCEEVAAQKRNDYMELTTSNQYALTSAYWDTKQHHEKV